MQIIIEDQTVELDLPHDKVTLKMVTDEIEAFLFTIGKVPVSLSINGVELTQEDLDRQETNHLVGTEAIKFGCITILEFLRENLSAAQKANPELMRKIEVFAKEIHTSAKTVNPQDFVVEMRHFFEFWLKIEALVPIVFENILCGPKNVRETLDEINSLLQECVMAMEDADFVLAADLMQYELLPNVLHIHNAIPQFLKKIDQIEAAATAANT